MKYQLVYEIAATSAVCGINSIRTKIGLTRAALALRARGSKVVGVKMLYALCFIITEFFESMAELCW
jgi:hypothetical protein